MAVPAPEDRCAVVADRRGDPMLGTAFPAARLLLVEQPFPWGPEGLRTSRFDRQTALRLEARGRESGVRVQAIRGLGPSREQAQRRWFLVDVRPASRALRTGTFEHDAELLDLPFDGSAGHADEAPLHLVCTHGRHDPCCAQRGRPVLARLAERRPGRVWQASHLGGCRFAPTVLTLPTGVMHGRVSPDDVDRLVAAEHGAVPEDLHRGRIGMPPSAQAAVAFARRRLGLTHVDDVRFVASRNVDRATAVVRVATTEREAEVTVHLRRTDASGLTCAHPGPTWFVAHDPVALELL